MLAGLVQLTRIKSRLPHPLADQGRQEIRYGWEKEGGVDVESIENEGKQVRST